VFALIAAGGVGLGWVAVAILDPAWLQVAKWVAIAIFFLGLLQTAAAMITAAATRSGASRVVRFLERVRKALAYEGTTNRDSPGHN
jgi:hypothetical protein